MVEESSHHKGIRGRHGSDFYVSSSDEWDRSSTASDDEKRATETSRPVQHQIVEENTFADKLNRQSKNHSFEYLNLGFMLISFGYMLPWTSLGGLISYYKYNYSASFYVKLYCAYYLPGLPVALLQHRFDGWFDRRFGSRVMYIVRGIVSFIAMICILISMVWFNDQYILIILFAALGVCAWYCHGTASMMASMYPASSIAYLQTGFRCPEIYTITAVAFLHLGKIPSQANLQIYYLLTAFVVLVGLGSWIFVSGSSTSKLYFDAKDDYLNDRFDDSETQSLFGASFDHYDSMSNRGGGGGYFSDEDDYEDDEDKHVDDNNHNNNNHKDNIDAESGMTTSHRTNDSDISSAMDDKPRAAHSNNDNSSSSLSPSSSTAMAVSTNKSSIKPHSTQTSAQTSLTTQAIKAVRTRPVGPSAKKLHQQQAMRNKTFYDVMPLCAALFITIFCSIFQASFFAYVNSPNGRDIEQILYFVRLFSDLVGRPLTRLPRPWCMKKGRHVLVASVLRVNLMALFFVYVLVPSFPRSDLFVCALVSVFSILSGYFTVLVYEYAANDDLDKAAQTYGTALLNICFQLAAFTAVLASVLITSMGWMDSFIQDA